MRPRCRRPSKELIEARIKHEAIKKTNKVALKILCALLSNPERYKYISTLIKEGQVTQEEANEKNINKAFKMADSFIKQTK